MVEDRDVEMVAWIGSAVVVVDDVVIVVGVEQSQNVVGVVVGGDYLVVMDQDQN